MSLTLRQYLELYHTKHQKSPSNQNYETKQLISLTSIDYGSQKLFQQKIANIKRLLRTCVEDFQIYLQIQKELQELKTIFYKNKNLSLTKSKSTIGGDVSVYKSSRSIKNHNRKRNTNTNSQTNRITSFPTIQQNEDKVDDLKEVSKQIRNNSKKRIDLSIGIQDSYEITLKRKKNGINRIKTEPTQEVSKQIQNRYSFNTKYNNFQIKEVDSKANSEIKIQLPKQELSPGLKSAQKNIQTKQFQTQSRQIHQINLISPKETSDSSKVSFTYRDKKMKAMQGPYNMNNTSQNLRIQSHIIQNNSNYQLLPPTLETKQSKYSESDDNIHSIRRTDFSKCSIAESKTFYFKK